METPRDHPSHDDGPPPDLDSLSDLLDQSSYGGATTSPEELQQRMFEQLAGSDDPMWREIGQQLRDGQMSLRHVLQVDAYWQHVVSGLDEHQEAFRGTVAAVQAQLEAEQADRRRAQDG